MQGYTLLLWDSLHFFKFSLFDSLVSEQMCPESSKSVPVIPSHFTESQRSPDLSLGSQNTGCTDPRSVGHGNHHAGGAETDGCVRQRYSYSTHVIISVPELVNWGISSHPSFVSTAFR